MTTQNAVTEAVKTETENKPNADQATDMVKDLKREKLLQYKRDYHKKRKAEREKLLKYKRDYHKKNRVTRKNAVDMIENLVAELKRVRAIEAKIVKQLKAIKI